VVTGVKYLGNTCSSVLVALVAIGCCDDENHSMTPLQEDTQSLRAVVGLWSTLGSPVLAADGRIDVYAIVAKRLRDERVPSVSTFVWLFSSDRLAQGPTWGQIQEKDYSEFPWRRYRGMPPAGRVVPLLWEPHPDRDGTVLVAFSNEDVRLVSEGQLEELLRELGQ